MKLKKIITISTVVLLVVIISLASFLGIYVKKEYKIINKVPKYTLGMEFTDCRVINLEVEEEKNSEEVLTIGNFEKAKSIIKTRLKGLGVDQYRVALDKNTGNIQIKIQENKNTDLVIYNLLQSGTFELRDNSSEEILMDTNLLKNIKVVYSQSESQTVVFLQVEFNKEGKQKLAELLNTYDKIAEENNEIESTENEDSKNIALYLNGEKIREIDLKETVMNEMLYISIGVCSDTETLEQYKTLAEETAAILNSGVLPIEYTETDNIEGDKITTEQIRIGTYMAIGIIALMTITFVISLKTKGILASILQIGYVALLLLTLRYTNVKITIEGVLGILIGTIINFVYTYKAFKNSNLDFVKNVTKKFAIALIPGYVVAIVFSFNKISNIYSLGMTLVWSFIVTYIYNLILTQITLKTINNQ